MNAFIFLSIFLQINLGLTQVEQSDSDQQLAQTLHNKFREWNHAPDFQGWCSYLVEVAMARVTYICETDDFTHNASNPYGENLAAYDPSLTNAQVITNGVSDWNAENATYDYSNPVFSQTTGHFTQVVWASTTCFGCAICRNFTSDWVYYCCNYDPKGNIEGQFSTNVLPH